MTASEALTEKIGLVIPVTRAAAARLWASSRLDRLYPRYLRAMHGIARAAVPLLDEARLQAERLPAQDPMRAPLCAYFAAHAEEERGHDVWILEDLAAAEADPPTLPPASVAALVGAQYYWLRHHHAAAVLGFLAVAEGDPPAPALAAHVVAHARVSHDAVRSIRRHARLDLRHRADLHALLDALPLASEHQRAIGVSALHAAAGLASVFDEIVGEPR